MERVGCVSDAMSSGIKTLSVISDAPHLDAQRLLLHVLQQQEVSWLFAHPEQELTSQQQQLFRQLVDERAAGQPLAYLLGTAEFYGREFLVNEHVLIPRPSTESLTDQALPYIDEWYKKWQRPIVIADIGTGSGCIAITLALSFSPPYEGGGGVVIYATDISAPALQIAQQNAQRHGVLDKIEFLQGNMLEPLKYKKIDLIVSNPPYISTNQISPDLAFEPRQALDGGPNGQQYINQIKASGLPALVESTGGHIEFFNIKSRTA